MSPWSNMPHRREQWQAHAKPHGKGARDERRAQARLTAERDQRPRPLKASQARVRAREVQRDGRATRPKVDVVHCALQRVGEARISVRAVSRVLALRAGALGIRKAPWAHTSIHGVLRLPIVRLDAARTVRGVPLALAPLTYGLRWRIASRIGLGSGTIVAVLALAAQHPQLESGAPALRHVHGLGVAVAEAWTGATIAEGLTRLIAQMGRPAASRNDNGSARHTAVALRADDGLDRPCLDDRSPAAAGMRTRPSHPPPACERVVSACGRASGQRPPPLLAGVAPPPVRTKARCMPVHRFVTWADRVLQLSPSGGATRGSLYATRRRALDALPDCHALRKRLQGDAGALLACQDRRKHRGLGTATVAQGDARMDAMPTAAIGQEVRASLTHHLGIATP